MPKWVQIARDYAATRKRFTMQSRLGEILTGILPTYQVERNWPGDQLDLYGINGITNATVPGAVPLHISASLHNISDRFAREEQKELLVWRIVAFMNRTDVISQAMRAEKLHLFTPITGYNPNAILATGPLPNTGVFLPWLQPQRPEETAHFPAAGHLDVGYNTALQVADVGGLINLGVGPTLFTQESDDSRAAISAYEFGLPGVDTPPYRLQPGRKLTVQTVFPQTNGLAIRMDASFWYSERPYAVGL